MGGLRILALPILQLGHFVSEAWTAARGETPHAEVPPLDASLAAIGEAVLDRSFTLGVNLLTGVPNPTEVRAAHEVQLARVGCDAELALEQCCGFQHL